MALLLPEPPFADLLRESKTEHDGTTEYFEGWIGGYGIFMGVHAPEVNAIDPYRRNVFMHASETLRDWPGRDIVASKDLMLPEDWARCETARKLEIAHAIGMFLILDELQARMIMGVATTHQGI